MKKYIESMGYSVPEDFDQQYSDGKYSVDESVKNIFGNVIDKYAGTGLTDAEKEANAFSAEEAQKSRDFQEFMARNKYQMETQSMQEAGINPAMVYGGGSLVPTASNGVAASSVAPSSGNLFDLISTIARLPAELSQIKATTERVEAEKENIQQDTRNKEQTYDINEVLNPLREEAQKLANNLTRAQERQIYKSIDEASERIVKMKAEVKTEEERAALLLTERMLNDAKAQQIVEMLPYQKALVEAQTSQAKAQALLAATNAAYQQGLIDSGYLDQMAQKMHAENVSAHVKAEFDKVVQSMRDGSFGFVSSDGSALGDLYSSLTDKAAHILSGVKLFVDTLNPLGNMLK